MYNKKEWVSKEVITKEALNNIENGIAELEAQLPCCDNRVFDKAVFTPETYTDTFGIEEEGMTFVKVDIDFNYTSIEELCKNVVSYKTKDLFSGEEVIYDNETIMSLLQSGSFEIEPGVLYSFDQMTILICFSDNNDVGITTGIWLLKSYDVGEDVKTFDQELTIELHISGELKQLDEKFISYKPGKIVADQTFMVDEVETIAQKGAEIFNNEKNIATGLYSHAEGCDTQAIGDCSHAEGKNTIAKGGESHAEGYESIAEGFASHAEGKGQAIGSYSHAEGSETQAIGDYSHAEGYDNIGSGICSHVEGFDNEIKEVGQYSHVEGAHCIVEGSYSHAEGLGCEVKGDYSHAEGYDTKASGNYQHVQGILNIEDTANKYAHIVGNGVRDTGAGDDIRSNAHTLDWDGNAWFAGKVTMEGIPTNDNDLVSKAYVDQKFNELATMITNMLNAANNDNNNEE